MAIDTVSELKAKLVEHDASVIILKNFEQLRIGDKSQYSTPFYTNPGGYKMCLLVYANGCHSDESKGTHISVFVCMMRGENDDRLTWPFSGEVNIELLNQLEDANHFARLICYTDEKSRKRVYTSNTGEGSGHRAFCPHSGLVYDATRNCQYLKDDCLCFRVRAKAYNLKPWLVPTGTF
jgi:TNF receptor-associated factor 4